jgi:hypothetical protein
MKNISNDTIGNGTRDLLALSAGLQPTAPPRAPNKSRNAKVQSTKGDQGQEEDYRHVSILSLTSAIIGVGRVVNATPRPLYPQERDPVTIVQETGWAPGPVWTVAGNFTTTGTRSPDRSARTESLY